MPTPDHSAALTACQQWLERAVIGLNLCPFARAPHLAGRIRWALSAAVDTDTLGEELLRELEHLRAHDIRKVETTLLVIPQLLGRFEDYLDLLHAAEGLVEALGYGGQFQLASFHPDYRFEGSSADAVENFSNRSPWPMLHLLREASISRVVDAGANVDSIPERNQQSLRELGRDALLKLLQD